MSNCCNRPPKGGTPNVGMLVKWVGIMLVAVLLLAYFAG